MSEENYDDDPIPIVVPIIIDEERFQRVAARRHSRAPNQKPPLHVNPKSSLTGLCKCGFCNSPMHIATGKGGRYRYLKCNRRNSISNTICTSPNVPFEKFETLVIETVAESVLTETRLQQILEDATKHIESLSKNHSEEANQVDKMRIETSRKLNHLIKLTELGKIQIDGVLGNRIRTLQCELDCFNAKANSLKTPVVLPSNLYDGLNLMDFRAEILSILMDSTSEQAKSFLHLVISEIRIYAEEATISGPNLGVLEAVMTKKLETSAKVPSFMYNWRRARDSNPRYRFKPVCFLSREVPSTTRPALRLIQFR